MSQHLGYGFSLVEDTPLNDIKRWVLVTPPGAREACLLLAKAASPEQAARVGDQTGGRVFLFLHTDDFDRDYERMRARGVRFREEPRDEPYGRVVVFEDLYGNRWDLLEIKVQNPSPVGRRRDPRAKRSGRMRA
jgi:catechol 2,3-dioxygenase-like lactoylglutathione lyase family enzyme